MATQPDLPNTNYEAAYRAERKRVVRCFHKHSSETRANLAASHRLGYQQRQAVGEFFYIHPDVPNVAFRSVKEAASAALRAQS